MDLELLARTSAVLIAAGALAAVLRRAASATRHLVWHLAIIIVLLAPALAPLAPALAILPVPGVPGVPDVPGVPEVRVAATSNSGEQPLTDFGIFAIARNLGTIGTTGTIGTAIWFLFCWVVSGVSVRRSKIAPAEWRYEAEKI